MKAACWPGPVKNTPSRTPFPDWAEQDPRDWLAAALKSVRQAVSAAGIAPRQVAGVGLTGQMHSLVCLDERGQPLRPAIIWADQRSRRQVRHLTSRIGQDNLAAWLGNPLAAGFMLVSWAWLRQHEPGVAERTRWLISPKDWVRYKLTGQIGSEPSDASATLLFNPHTRAWSQPVLAAAGLSLEQLPPVSEFAGGGGDAAARNGAGLRSAGWHSGGVWVQ